MKIQCFFKSLILTTWFILLFNGDVFAFHMTTASRNFVSCMDLKLFCNYQGMRDNLEKANEEFNMLLEPTRNPNFQSMQMILDRILGCACSSGEHMDVLKNKPDCNVTKYTKRLIEFYENNRENIIKNTEKEDPDLEIIALFESFKKKVRNDLVQK